MTETRTAETSGVTVRCGRQLQHVQIAQVGPNLLTVRSYRAPNPPAARAGGEDAGSPPVILAAHPIPAAAAGHLRRVSFLETTRAGVIAGPGIFATAT